MNMPDLPLTLSTLLSVAAILPALGLLKGIGIDATCENFA